MAHVDFGLVELLGKLKNVGDKGKIEAVRERVLKRVGAKALIEVKQNHPTITGYMKESWHAFVRGKKMILENPVTYAPHVNYGHRVVRGGKTVGFTRGNFMLERTMKRMAKRELKPELEAAMREILGGFK